MKTLTLLALTCLASSASAAPQAHALGEKARHRFDKAPVNALGVKGLEDLLGKPVLVAYWGHTTWADDWVQDVYVWQKEYGADLAVIFIDMQGATQEKAESVALKKRWLDSRAIWSDEPVAWGGEVGVPQYSLLSNEGELILTGVAGMNGMSFVKRRMEEIEDAIAEQVRLRREGPEGSPAPVKALYEQFSGGKIGAALAKARELAAEGEPTEAASAALAEFERRLDRRLVRAEALIEEGRVLEAEEELDGLERQLEAEPELLARAKELGGRLESEDLAPEREAAKAFESIFEKLNKKGTKSANVRSLEKFAKKYAGTKNAARAERWVRLAEMK